MGAALTAEETARALAAISQWRLDFEASVACPRCTAPGLSIIDRSARPHAEWYELACASCGLATTLHMPLASPPASLD